MASQLDNFSKFGNWDLPLRIQRRGNFFSDDRFQDYRRCFESAAKDLLKEFDISRNEDTFTTYRRLRDHQLTGTDRTTKIAEESDKYKIVMDVEGFSEGDLQVKVSGPNEIMVEGRQEFSNGGGAFSQRSFRRRFSLPGLALLEDASSVLSSDNVLTVHIPKKVQEITEQSQQSSTTTKQQQQQQQQTSQFDTIKNKLQENLQKAQDSVSSFMSDNTQTTSAPSFGNGGSNLFDVQIVPRQSFFNDSYFENVRHNFQKSIDDLMETRRRRISSIEEDAGIFRKVRETKVENAQAVSVTEDAKEHKIVLDVSGFSEADLKLRAVTECELVVEGKVDQKTSCTSCSHSFKKRFVLPSSVDIRKATSALSSEGILTILVPKKLESIDYAIPVRTETATSSHVSKDAATHISDVIKKEQEKEDNVLSKKHHVDQHLSGESCTSTTTTKTTTRVSESQNLLGDLEKSVEKGKKMCEMADKREHVVPINLEEQDTTVKVTSEERSDVTQETHEPSSVLKESQRLLTESTKLISDLEASEKKKQTEYFVPVEVDAGTPVNTSTQQTTHVTQQTSHSQKVPSEEVTLQSSVQQHHYVAPDTTKSRPASRIVPISLKGSVYSESVFDDARKNIEKNVQDVFLKYRQSSDVEEGKETTQAQTTVQDSTSIVKNGQTAPTVQEDDHSYKIVIDVYGFEEKELNAKVSGVNEISIEGSSEKTKNGSISKHSFQRTFQLPDCIDLERTSTALSEEGILTVTVPKKNQLLLKNEKVTPISSKISQEMKKSKEVKTTLVIDSSGIVQESKTDKSVASDLSDNTSQISSKTSTTQDTSTAPIVSQISQSTESSDHRREYVVPVSLEEASDVASEAGSIYSTSNLSSQMSTVSDTSRDVSQDILSAGTSASSIDTQIQSKTHASDETSGKVIHIQGLDGSDAATTRSTTAASSFDDHTRDILSRRGTLFNLPIMSRGHFFDDNIFQDSRSMFESILRNKMNRFSKSSSFVDDIGFFKSLREKKITGGNQMATLSEDDHFNKIVLDVQGFNENNLKVKALSDSEILIEGELEEKTGSSISRKTFRKHFILPGRVDLQGATSALSSDGVLNIKIPKKF